MTRSDLHEILVGAAEATGAHIRLGVSWTSLDQHDGITRRHLSSVRFDPVDTGLADGG